MTLIQMESAPLHWDHPQVRELIDLALREDIGDGDVTTEACVQQDVFATGFFLAKQALTLAGTPLLPLLYGRERVQVLVEDGHFVDDGEVFARVRDSARTLLTLERTALNLIQRTCGIASQARQYVSALRGTGCTLLDTRKTQPGMRIIDKLAVRAGGGTNHRIGLFDAVLIKNNHIAAAGSVTEAIRSSSSVGLGIEIEVQDSNELDEALDCGVKHVLLDNFTPRQVAQAVRRIRGRATVEVSGNITLTTIRDYAEAGADYASVGALTHSAPAADISFRLEQGA